MALINTCDLIVRMIAGGGSFISSCSTYVVHFSEDAFFVQCPAIGRGEAFDEEEFSLAFSDTIWEPVP